MSSIEIVSNTPKQGAAIPLPAVDDPREPATPPPAEEPKIAGMRTATVVSTVSRSNLPSANRTWRSAATVLGLSIIGLFMLTGYSLFSTLQWMASKPQPSEYFILTSTALMNSGLLRFLAMLIGVAIAAGGLLVSFLTISESIGISGSAGGTQSPVAAAMRTNSPGTVGLVAGCFVVCFAIFFRPQFSAQPPDSIEMQVPVQTPERPARLEDAPPLPTSQKKPGNAHSSEG